MAGKITLRGKDMKKVLAFMKENPEIFDEATQGGMTDYTDLLHVVCEIEGVKPL